MIGIIIAEQIAIYLTAMSVGTFSKLTSDGNIYIDTLPTGDGIIGIYNRSTYGRGGGDWKTGYSRVGIQVIYRGNKDPIASFTKAQQIFSTLDNFVGNFVEGQNHIVSCLSVQGQAESIGRSESLDYEYSMNFMVEYKK